MLKIKITLHSKEIKNPSIFNFTNTQGNIYNNKQYFINTKVESPDFWFVNEDIYENNYEEVNINKENIFFISTETIYEEDYFFKDSKINFLNQFNEVYSPKPIYIKNVVNTPPFIPWGLRMGPYHKHKISDLEYYSNLYPIKNRLMSVYASDKDITDHQKLRIKFLKVLQDNFNYEIDFYGTAFKKTKIKEEGILNYKYHIVIENNSYKNIISEKLFDSFLGLAYPLYSGATNLEDYFPKESFTYLDISDFNGSIDKIKFLIENDPYSEKVKALEISRNIVLKEFNVIKRIDNIVESKLSKWNMPKKNIRIYNKRHFENKSLLAKLLFLFNSKIMKSVKYLEKFYT